MARRLSLIVLAVLLVSFTAGPKAQTSAPGTVAFVNVTVLPMDSERTLTNHTVVTSNGRITAVGPSASTPVPQGATVVDGRGKFLLPGLAEMHGHLPNPIKQREYTEDVLFLYVAAGVTTVRSMQGSPGQLELREQVRRGELVGPTLFLAGPGFSGGAVKSPEDAVQRVRQQKQEGWDLLKILPGVSRESYDAMARTAKEVQIPFAGHIPAAVGIEHAIEMGQQTVDHIDGYIEALDAQAKPIDPTRLQQLIDKTKTAGTWVVPTMYVWETLFGAVTLESRTGLPELRYLPQSMVASWTKSLQNRLSSPQYNEAQLKQFIANRMQILKAMQDSGVKLLLGSDAPQQFNVPGFSIHLETRRMADAGLTPYQILRSGSVAIGEHYADRKDDPFGRVAVGQRADLILADANPLEDVANLERRSGVMVRGRWLPASEIQARLDQIAAKNKER
jgi:imidazolonepropionase-like amidohydrolase